MLAAQFITREQGWVAGYRRLLEMGALEERRAWALEMLNCCTACPRNCAADRSPASDARERVGVRVPRGYCQNGFDPRVSSINLHFGEEPPITGTRGSGTVFFAHCNMRCAFCQNYPLSHQGVGRPITAEELARGMVGLERRGAHNINLVTPSHVVPQLILAVAQAAELGLSIPIVYNSSGYDSLESLAMLEGIVDVYLPDIKWQDGEAAGKYSKAPDYPEHARAAIKEMFRQVGHLVLDGEGIARRGVLVRHLVMPNGLAETRKAMGFLAENLGRGAHVSLMAQYFPTHKAAGDPLIGRRITADEYEEALEALLENGLEEGYQQDLEEVHYGGEG